MIAFSPIRTRRLHVRMKELTIGDAIELCKMPPAMNEAGITRALQAIVEPEDKPRVGQVTDPRLWTVQERSFALAHYLAHTAEDGPDFAIGTNRFSDYMIDTPDAPSVVELGTVAGDKWRMFPLLGAYAESVERLIAGGRLQPGRGGWWFGAMAAQMCEGEADPLPTDIMDAELDDLIFARAQVFMSYPQSEAIELIAAFHEGQRRLDHLLVADFSDEGVVFQHSKSKEVPGLPPARFLFDSAVSEFTRQAFV